MFLALTLGLCSCGINDHLAETLPMERLRQSDPVVDSPVSGEETGTDQKEESLEEGSQEVSFGKTDVGEDNKNANAGTTDISITDSAKEDTAGEGPWSVTITPNTADYTAEDGTLIFSLRSDILTIYNSKDPDAAAKRG